MKKKKILSVFLVGIICFGLCFSLINAASKYYEYRWTNEVVDSYDHDYYITNDIIETDDGYVTAGFYDGSYPSVRFLNEDGLLIKEVEPNLEEPQMTKRIFAIDGGYLVVGMDGYGVSLFTIDAKTYKIVYSDVYWTDNFDWDDEVYYEEDDNFVYLISDWSNDSIVRIDKSLESPVIAEISTSGFSKKVSAWVEKYIGIWNLKENYDENGNSIYYPTFVTDYAEGYVYGYDSAFYYIVDGKVEWMIENDDAFIKDGIQLGDNFVVTLVEWTEEENDNWSEKSYLEVYDKEGNLLSRDDISNYIDEEARIFYPEHLVAVGNTGFALTGSEQFEFEVIPVEEQGIPQGISGLYKPDKKPEHGKRPENGKPMDTEGMEPGKGPEDVQAGPGANEYPVSSQVLYFDMIHEIITKTDGNGTITATKVTAYWGEGIEFTIEPKEGYVLSEVRVTDANGNVITFTDYKFTMPNADVTIEATFSVKNPETYAFIGISLFVLFIGSAMFIVNKKNKPSKYNN